VLLLLFAAPLFVCAACALGEEDEPGCHADAECGGGFVCRAGACFRLTTGLSPPQDPAEDGGDGGDAGDITDAGEAGPSDSG
jgi:hypothetical protein